MSYVIKTHDGKTLAIKQNEPGVIKALANRLELTPVELLSGEIVYLSRGNVARIEKDPTIRPTVDREHRIEKTNEITDEQREKNRERIAKMREDFNTGRLKKHNNSDTN